MLKFITWDKYTLIIVALIPTIMGIAGALTLWDDHRLHEQQCQMAVEWLQESERIAPQFTSAGTMAGIDQWISQQEEFDAPTKAGELRYGFLSSARYQNEYFPDVSTSTGGVLNPPDGLYSRSIIEGAEELIEHCPETQEMLPAALPMVFTEVPEVEDNGK